jgi:hypothetical protein
VQGWLRDNRVAALDLLTSGHSTTSALTVQQLRLACGHIAMQLEGDSLYEALGFLSDIATLLPRPGHLSPPHPASATDLPSTLCLLAKAPSSAGACQQAPQQVHLCNVTVSRLQCIFSLAAPTDKTRRGSKRSGNLAARIPIMLLSAAGVSCANLTVRPFDSGPLALSAAKVQARYTNLVKEAIFMVCISLCFSRSFASLLFVGCMLLSLPYPRVDCVLHHRARVESL